MKRSSVKSHCETHSEDLTKSYYEVRADEYFRATYSANLPQLWEKLSTNLRRNDRILDLGCGSGRDLRYFAQRGFRVIGIDYSPRLVELARGYSKQPVVLGDFASLPFEDNSFDAVWSIGSLLHVPRSSISSVLSEVRRVLKDNAVLLTSVKKGLGEEIDPLGRHNVFYTPDEWGNIHSEKGYEIVELEEMIEERKTEPNGTQRITWIVCLARAVRNYPMLSPTKEGKETPLPNTRGK